MRLKEEGEKKTAPLSLSLFSVSFTSTFATELSCRVRALVVLYDTTNALIDKLIDDFVYATRVSSLPVVSFTTLPLCVQFSSPTAPTLARKQPASRFCSVLFYFIVVAIAQ